MIWENRHGILFSGEYRLYCNSRGDYDIWLYTPKLNGCIKRGVTSLTRAKMLAQNHEANEIALSRMVGV